MNALPSLLIALTSTSMAAGPCRIEIVDKENGWPVPLVELRTVHDTRFISDNAGLIALDAPELMDREVWFHVKGNGYGVERDGFGYEGLRISPKPGGTVRIEIERRTVAKRLGRLSGAGLFAEQQKLGIVSPATETGVFGCDSVLLARRGDGLFWLWGDTLLPHYPLGLFHSTAALTPTRPIAEFKPPLSVPYRHFRDETGKIRNVAHLPGDGPTWLSGLIELPDASGKRRLVANYSKIKPPLEEYETGLCVWDEGTENFLPHRLISKGGEKKPPLIPRGHPTLWTDDQGTEWVLFGDPFPTLRCHATFEAWQDPARWEKIDPPAHPRSAADGSEVKAHRGSIAWNPHRERWVTVFTQEGGKPSFLGEIWYAESPSPTGPWGNAVKILSHDNYTFYNPRIHPELVPEDAGFIVFEGTFTADFADKPVPVPRYNYNQVLYRLDLDDPKLAPAK